MRISVFYFSFMWALLFVLAACDETSTTDTSPSVTALACTTASFSATATESTAYSGTASLPYTGGNGASYAAGSAIASTGVTGLTATLQAGTLANGAGNLSFAISGTPAASGTASFAVSFGGQTCTLTLTVQAKGGSTTDCTAPTGVAKIVCLAEAFKATLSTSQLSIAQLEYNATNAKKWSNLPASMSARYGINFGALNATQLAAAKALVKEASGTVANEGYDEAVQIWDADDYLSVNGGGSTYGSGNYYLSILGTPSMTGTWELLMTGHHITMATTYVNGVLKGSTPHFLALEPLSFTASGKTLTPMSQEQAALAAMLTGLSDTQLSTAKLATAQTDLLLGPGKDGQFPSTKSGVKVSTLSTAQKTLVMNAIKTWVQDTNDTAAAAFIAKYESELDNTYLAYAGTTALNTQADYVRIDGPSVWIEFSCQGGIIFRGQIHYHSIWRDRTTDYGGSF